MAEGRVDAVVVGADRIAANGDTGGWAAGGSASRMGASPGAGDTCTGLPLLRNPCTKRTFAPPTGLRPPHTRLPRLPSAANKIGTFSHAVSAHHHDIPFFVAAPTTTIDPTLDHGGLIPIEQRAAEEVGADAAAFALCGGRGGWGEQGEALWGTAHHRHHRPAGGLRVARRQRRKRCACAAPKPSLGVAPFVLPVPPAALPPSLPPHLARSGHPLQGAACGGRDRRLEPLVRCVSGAEVGAAGQLGERVRVRGKRPGMQRQSSECFLFNFPSTSLPTPPILALRSTPAKLIEGIVTERGLVPRAGAAGSAFAIRDWLEAGGNGGANGSAAGAHDASPGRLMCVCLAPVTLPQLISAQPAHTAVQPAGGRRLTHAPRHNLPAASLRQLPRSCPPRTQDLRPWTATASSPTLQRGRRWPSTWARLTAGTAGRVGGPAGYRRGLHLRTQAAASGRVALDSESSQSSLSLPCRQGSRRCNFSSCAYTSPSSRPCFMPAFPTLRAHFSHAVVEEVGDGNINFVYILEGPAGALCVKQALPFVRVVGESWPLTQVRFLAWHGRAARMWQARTTDALLSQGAPALRSLLGCDAPPPPPQFCILATPRVPPSLCVCVHIYRTECASRRRP